MKIVYVHSSLPVGGAEILRGIVARELLTRKVDFRICLISGGGKISDDLKQIGIQIDTLGCNNSIYNPITTLKFASYLRDNKPDIVQSSQFNSNFHTRIAAKLAGIPIVVCEEHGLYSWKQWWHRLADRLLEKWCDKIIAVSGAVKKFNIDKIGLPPEIIQVLPNCIDIHKFQTEKDNNREHIRREFGLKNSDFVFGHVGTLREEKGHDVLLKAFIEFRKNFEAKLLFIGDGPLRPELEKLTDVLGIQSDVVFCGSRNDIPSILGVLDVFVFPSRNEALGIALLEAMYAGLPVIGSNIGGIPEIISDGETGLLVPSEDCKALCIAMEVLYGDEVFRKKLGAAAHRYVEKNHNPAKYVDQLQMLYNKLLSRIGTRTI